MVKDKPLKFKVIWEDWNSYMLEGNLTLKLKAPLIRIVDNEPREPTGKARLGIDADTLSRIEGDVELHEPSPDITIRPQDIIREVRFERIEENVQIYYIPELMEVLLLKAFPKRVSLTSKYDKIGYPIHVVDTVVGITSVKVPEFL